MLFFGLLAGLTFIGWALRVPGWPARMRIAMALALVLAGTDHWLNPERYLPMMPAWVPLHLEVVLFTGAAEIAGAIGLLVPRLRRMAGFMLAQWYYWARLAFQPLAIWWALFSAQLIRWPFHRRLGVQS